MFLDHVQNERGVFNSINGLPNTKQFIATMIVDVLALGFRVRILFVFKESTLRTRTEMEMKDMNNPYALPVDPTSGFHTPELAQGDIAVRMMDAIF